VNRPNFCNDSSRTNQPGSGIESIKHKKGREFHGFLRNTDGLPIIISKGLWGLGFGNGGTAGPTNALYFASDFVFGGQFHGLFGTLTAAPSTETAEPDMGYNDHGHDQDYGYGHDGDH
jgi:hypothetical protein